RAHHRGTRPSEPLTTGCWCEPIPTLVVCNPARGYNRAKSEFYSQKFGCQCEFSEDLHMKKSLFLCAILAVLLFAWTAPAQTRSLPTFEVDRSWPKVPPQWKLGDPSSIAIDAKDNVWVLHRPRTLKPEEASKAAPPVIVFDTAGS